MASITIYGIIKVIIIKAKPVKTIGQGFFPPKLSDVWLFESFIIVLEKDLVCTLGLENTNIENGLLLVKTFLYFFSSINCANQF